MSKLKAPFYILIFLCLFCTSCSPLKRSYPEKNYFALNIPGAPVYTSKFGKSAVRIKSFKAPPQYQNKNFVYRIGENEYTTDFYNEFLTAPTGMIAVEAARWFENAGLFKNVIMQSSQILPDFVIEGAIENLYGDFKDKANAKAVISIKLFLIDARKAKSRIVLQKTYNSSQQLGDDSPEELVKGWNKGLAEIFDNFAKDVEAIPVHLIKAK